MTDPLRDAVARVFGGHDNYDPDQFEDDLEICSEAALTPEDIEYEKANWRWGMDGKGGL